MYFVLWRRMGLHMTFAIRSDWQLKALEPTQLVSQLKDCIRCGVTH